MAAPVPLRRTVQAVVEERTPLLITLLVLLNLYVICSRAPELLYVVSGIRVPLWPVILNGLAFLCLFSGIDIRRVWFSKVSIAVMLFTGWVLFALPFSYHKGGSLSVLMRGWIPSLIVFYVMSGNVRSMSMFRKVALVIGFCSFQIAMFSFLLGKALQDRYSMEVGTLANANDLSALLLYGFPFVVYRAIRPGAGILAQLISGGVGALVLLLVLRTGSRSGVLTVLLIAAMGMLWSTWGVRIKVLLVTAVSLVLVIPFVPGYALQRIMTLVDDNAVEVGGEAEASSRSRKDLFFTSLRLAIEHPLVGVGIGEFAAAEYFDALEAGRRAKWLAPHNTLAQVASENGFPALFFYTAFLTIALFRADRARRNWKRMEGWGDNYSLAMCLELSMLGYLFNSMFGSNAYLPYLPILAGLSEASLRLSEQHASAVVAARANVHSVVAGSAPNLAIKPLRRTV